MSIGTLPRNAPLIVAGSYTLIEEVMPSGTGTVTFSNIPQNFTHLELRWSVRGSTASADINLFLRFNGASGASDYAWQIAQILNATVAAVPDAADTGALLGNIPGSTAVAGYAGVGTARIYDYKGTTFQKYGDSFAQNRSADAVTGFPYIPSAFTWKSTAAITSITALLASGNFEAGSKISLYGIGSAGITQFNNTVQLIDSISPSGVGTITFSAIPQIYSNLEIRYTARGTQAATSTALGLQFNGDAGANYDTQLSRAVNATFTGAEVIASTSIVIGQISAASATAGLVGGGKINIYNYRGTTFNKVCDATDTYKTSNASGNIAIDTRGGAWRSTAAITSVTLGLASGNYEAGSKFDLYGYR
jgi:hypothetical protein